MRHVFSCQKSVRTYSLAETKLNKMFIWIWLICHIAQSISVHDGRTLYFRSGKYRSGSTVSESDVTAGRIASVSSKLNFFMWNFAYFLFVVNMTWPMQKCDDWWIRCERNRKNSMGRFCKPRSMPQKNVKIGQIGTSCWMSVMDTMAQYVSTKCDIFRRTARQKTIFRGNDEEDE